MDGCFYRIVRREKKKDGSDKVNCLSRLGGSRVCFRVVPKEEVRKGDLRTITGEKPREVGLAWKEGRD